MSRTFSRKPGLAGMDGRRASGHAFVGPFFVTAHAAARFMERIAPGLSLGHARSEAVALAQSARRTGEKTPRGHEIWEATDGAPVRFVVKRDPAMGLVCVTVLGPNDRDDASEPRMMLDAAAE